MLQRRMTIPANIANHLSDRALIDEVKSAAARERGATVRLIALLAELDARRLYLGEGCSSLFTYCVQVLRLSEHAAYGRIEAARVARKFPVVIDLMAEGAVTLTAITLLGPMLTPENHQRSSPRPVIGASAKSNASSRGCVRSPPLQRASESYRLQEGPRSIFCPGQLQWRSRASLPSSHRHLRHCEMSF